ncbi:hypothetical protein [Pelagibacterium sediminicola]|uniref:hypothetical protein n=1 Tax=Pelagibacterium sediminicola TaxID=2248761 RepID=UPI000E30D941|nr:hypothetical protein [Pelagibacterium sediminicola]
MVLLLMFIAGSAGWMTAEAVALVAGGIGVADGTLGAIALFVLAAGIFGLQTEPGMGRQGRVGIVLVAFGAMSFSMVLIITLTSGVLGAIASGEITYGAMVWTPFYLLALAFTAGGLVALGLHYRQQGATALAAVLGGLAALHLARALAIDAFALHRSAGIATALVFALIGIRKLSGR